MSKNNLKIFNKLVRDNVPQLIEVSDRKVKCKTLQHVDRPEALRNKLNEEVDELLAAQTSEEILEEVVDVYEVLLAIIYEAGFIDADLELRAKQKRRHYGSFDKFVWLECVECTTENKL